MVVSRSSGGSSSSPGRSGHVRFVVDKVDRCLRVLRFSLPSIPPIAPHSLSSIIIRGWYNRPVVAAVTVDLVPLEIKGKKSPNENSFAASSHQLLHICTRLQIQQTFANPVTVNPDVRFLFIVISTTYLHLFIF
jgi:hypothetical protein